MDNLKKFYGWTDRKLKGNIAETIVEHMLEYSGYKVYRFGYEKFLEKIKNVKINQSDEKKKIVFMPDFIVVSKEGKADFIEVKYRKKGFDPSKIETKIIELSKTWPDARIILVSLKPPHFQISRIKEFVDNGKLYRLEEDQFIKVSKEVIRRYEELVIKYYK